MGRKRLLLPEAEYGDQGCSSGHCEEDGLGWEVRATRVADAEDGQENGAADYCRCKKEVVNDVPAHWRSVRGAKSAQQTTASPSTIPTPPRKPAMGEEDDTVVADAASVVTSKGFP